MRVRTGLSERSYIMGLAQFTIFLMCFGRQLKSVAALFLKLLWHSVPKWPVGTTPLLHSLPLRSDIWH